MREVGADADAHGEHGGRRHAEPDPAPPITPTVMPSDGERHEHEEPAHDRAQRERGEQEDDRRRPGPRCGSSRAPPPRSAPPGRRASRRRCRPAPVAPRKRSATNRACARNSRSANAARRILRVGEDRAMAIGRVDQPAQVVRAGQAVEEEILRGEAAGRGKRRDPSRLRTHHRIHLPQVVDDRQRVPNLGDVSRSAADRRWRAAPRAPGARHPRRPRSASGASRSRRSARSRGVVAPERPLAGNSPRMLLSTLQPARAGERQREQHGGDREHGPRTGDHQAARPERRCQPALVPRALPLPPPRARQERAHRRDERHLDQRARSGCRTPSGGRRRARWSRRTSRATRSRGGDAARRSPSPDRRAPIDETTAARESPSTRTPRSSASGSARRDRRRPRGWPPA